MTAAAAGAANRERRDLTIQTPTELTHDEDSVGTSPSGKTCRSSAAAKQIARRQSEYEKVSIGEIRAEPAPSPSRGPHDMTFLQYRSLRHIQKSLRYPG